MSTTRRGFLAGLGAASVVAVVPAVTAKQNAPTESGPRLVRATENIKPNAIVVWDAVDEENVPQVRMAKFSDTPDEQSAVMVGACLAGEYNFAIVNGRVSERFNDHRLHRLPENLTVRDLVRAADGKDWTN